VTNFVHYTSSKRVFFYFPEPSDIVKSYHVGEAVITISRLKVGHQQALIHCFFLERHFSSVSNQNIMSKQRC